MKPCTVRRRCLPDCASQGLNVWPRLCLPGEKHVCCQASAGTDVLRTEACNPVARNLQASRERRLLLSLIRATDLLACSFMQEMRPAGAGLRTRERREKPRRAKPTPPETRPKSEKETSTARTGVASWQRTTVSPFYIETAVRDWKDGARVLVLCCKMSLMRHACVMASLFWSA